MSQPLAGLRMLDLTHMLSGPYGGMILADLGAETIKIEPLRGEGTRKLLATDPNNSLNGMGAYYLTLNRNKKSVLIDLKTDQGLGVFKDLVAKSDIVISNFGAGVPERLGIDYKSLSNVNPRIITCTVSGFGSDGPGSRRPAFDQVAQAMGGGMSITGADAAYPVRAGIPVGDLGGGMFGVMGVLAALYERERSGVGQHVDISMLDCQISMLNYMATMHFLSGEDPYPIGNSHFVHVPYNTFSCSNGSIVIAVITDNFWQYLKEVVNCPDFDNIKYDTQPGRWEDRDMINSTLNQLLSTNTCQYWLAKFESKRIPCAPVNSLSQALSDEQVLHRNMVIDLKGLETLLSCQGLMMKYLRQRPR
jgi:CoA:oxalate CoA-transferase